MSDENWGLSPLPFIPGRELNRHFYWEAVRPVLDRFFPGLPHTAALVGYGSDVLGYDTPMSRDHMWGPRLTLFLEPDAFPEKQPAIDEALRLNLPPAFAGYPTHFSPPDHDNVRWMATRDRNPVDHLITILTLPTFIRLELGLDLNDRLQPRDWLVLPQQKLLAVTSGEVFHDGLNFAAVRTRFHFYPPEVWFYLLACQWARIGQEEAFVGRTGDLGDELGSRVIASRLVYDLMRLAFLMERQYTPYSKWFGTAFNRLAVAPALSPVLADVLAAADWKSRESRLAQAYEIMAKRHHKLDLTEPIEWTTRGFFGRPFRVLFAGRFAEALQEKIKDPWLKTLPFYGSIDQFSTSTDLLEDADAWPRLRHLYPPG